jgi:hypothetical protein
MSRRAAPVSIFIVLLLLAGSLAWQQALSGLAGGDQPPASLVLSSSALTVTPGETFSLDLMLDMEPSSHAVSTITAVLTFDATILATTAVSLNSTDFPQLQIVESVRDEPGTVKLALGTGSDAAAAIQTSATLATISFRAIGQDGSSTLIDWQQATALSVSNWDESSQNIIGSAIGATVAVNAPANWMSVGDIQFSSKAAKRSYSLSGTVLVKANGVAVNGATVTVQWTDPNGSTVTQTVKTNRSGLATFKRTVTAKGTYTLTVTNVTKSGYTYNASGNIVTTKSITIS